MSICGLVHPQESKTREEDCQAMNTGLGHTGREFQGLGLFESGIEEGSIDVGWASPLGPIDSLLYGQW